MSLARMLLADRCPAGVGAGPLSLLSCCSKRDRRSSMLCSLTLPLLMAPSPATASDISQFRPCGSQLEWVLQRLRFQDIRQVMLLQKHRIQCHLLCKLHSSKDLYLIHQSAGVQSGEHGKTAGHHLLVVSCTALGMSPLMPSLSATSCAGGTCNVGQATATENQGSFDHNRALKE